MSLETLHENLLQNPEYQAAYAEEDLIHRVALRVLQLREASGLSQEGLAELVGTKQPDIAKIEGGGANLTLRRVARIAYVLGYDPEALVARESPEFVTLEWEGEAMEHYTTIHSGAIDSVVYSAANSEMAEAA